MTRLILASASKARQEMLSNAGLTFEVLPADIDEDSIIQRDDGRSPADKAGKLAFEKARAVSADNAGALVIGSDQILVHDNALLQKAADEKQALEKLQKLRGDWHELISAVSVVQDEQELWSAIERASLKMADLDDAALESYAGKAGDALTRSVGAYELEGLGAALFDKIDGDYFTILGMPLLPLLKYLRVRHSIRPF